DGKTAAHHTSVVAAVDANGRVTAVYEQNVDVPSGGGTERARYVVRQALDLGKLTGGYVKVYRPDARTPPAGRYEFTVVNNTTSSVQVTEQVGTSVSSYALAGRNTAASYQARAWTTTGGGQPTITVGGKTFLVEDGAAYEIFTAANGAVSLAKFSK